MHTIIRTHAALCTGCFFTMLLVSLIELSGSERWYLGMFIISICVLIASICGRYMVKHGIEDSDKDPDNIFALIIFSVIIISKCLGGVFGAVYAIVANHEIAICVIHGMVIYFLTFLVSLIFIAFMERRRCLLL